MLVFNKHGIRILDSHTLNKTRSIAGKIRLSREYVEWAVKILERDRGKCQSCGRRKLIQVHHKKSLSKIIDEKKILTLKDARKCRELWDVSNSEVLCEKCHAGKHIIKEEELWRENII